MPELNIDLDFFEHPKTLILCAELGDWAEILPIRLWRFTARYHPETALIEGPSLKFLEHNLKWKGEKGKGIALLVEAGFLKPTESGYAVHDFLARNGHIAALSKRGKTGAKSRWDRVNKPSEKCQTDAQAMQETKQAMQDASKSDDLAILNRNQVMQRDGPSNALTILTKLTNETNEANFTSACEDSAKTASQRPKMRPPPKTPEDLAQLFAATYTGTNRSMRDVYLLAPFFAELHRQGKTIAELAARISDPERSTNESTGQFEINAGYQRFSSAKAKTVALSGSQSLLDEAKARGEL